MISLFWIFFRIGLIGFGGGYAILSVIMRDLDNLGVSVQQFADLTALDLVTPGPIAINAATYVGYLNEGVLGSIVATLSICAPAYALVLTVARFIEKFRDSKVVAGMLAFVRPAAIGMVAAAAVAVAATVIFGEGATFESFVAEFSRSPATSFSAPAAVIFAAASVALVRFKLDPILVTLLAGAAGFLFA